MIILFFGGDKLALRKKVLAKRIGDRLDTADRVPKYKSGDRFVVEVDRVLPPDGDGEFMYRLDNGVAWMESRLDGLSKVSDG